MTEKNAIETVKGIIDEITSDENAVCYVTECDKEPLEMAIKALEKQSMINEILDEMWTLNEISKDYSAIGTLEEFKELKEKATPKKPINQQGFPRFGYCPTCEKSVTKSSSYVGCAWCLQALDWSE